ncbi:hypothetical protein QL285_024963 [Trifolium repens]|nr:hypothetical protein QL285_024963 [Trifolium repens]
MLYTHNHHTTQRNSSKSCLGRWATASEEKRRKAERSSLRARPSDKNQVLVAGGRWWSLSHHCPDSMFYFGLKRESTRNSSSNTPKYIKLPTLSL